MHFIGAVGLLLGIVTLIALSWRGVHTVISAIAAAIVVMLFNTMSFWPTMNTGFMVGAADFFKQYFLIFALGATFGEVMSKSGSAQAIAKMILGKLGKNLVILALVLVTAILSYVGINIFVIVFVLYPLARPLLKEANISKNILPGLILFAGVTLMLPAPGSPTGTNATPTTVLGTTIYAGAIMGIICLAVAFVLGYMYLIHETKKLSAQGIGFEDIDTGMGGTSVMDDDKLPAFGTAIVPVVVVIAVIFLTKGILASFDSINTGLGAGIFATILLNLARMRGETFSSLAKGITNSLSPVVTTAAIVGFGSVVQASPAFTMFVNFSEYLSTAYNPYISAIISINIISGICGAAIPGIRIFSNLMLPAYLNYNIDPEAMHRVLVIAAGGLDTLPHCSTVAILYGVMGLTHKKSYKYIFVVSVLLPIAIAFLAVGLFMIGIV